MLKYDEYIKEARNLRHPFLQAAVRGNNNKVKEFIKSGVDINMKDFEGKTALMNAALNSFLMVVITLLNAGADPNLQDNNGRTALMMASTNKIFDKLFDAGADVNITNNDGDSIVMDRISHFINQFVDSKIGAASSKLFKKLIDNGLDFSIRNKSGQNFYEKLINMRDNQNTGSYWKERYDEMINYMNEHYPQYKEEWEMKQNVNKYNL